MKKKLVLLILLLLVFTNNVYAESKNSSCEMSDEYKEWLALPEEKRNEIAMPYYCKDFSKNKIKNSLPSYKNSFDLEVESNEIPSSFDLRNVDGNNYVTSVKNQKQTGTCEAHAGLSVIESNILFNYNKTYDFSELHLSYMSSYNYFSDGVNNEGQRNAVAGASVNFAKIGSYLTKLKGPILESEFPFDDYYDTSVGTAQNYNVKTISLSDLNNKNTIADVNNIIWFDFDSCTTDALKTIKKYIMENGAIDAYYYSDAAYTNGSYLFHNGTEDINHAISIIGWNDAISKTKFKNGVQPENDGAFIIKNSWGTLSGDNGYYYISYEDTNICKSITGYNDVDFDIENNVYYYDQLGHWSGYGYGNSEYTAWAANKFLKKTNNIEFLKEITIGTRYNTDYELYISYADDNNEIDLDKRELIGTGNINHSGYGTHKFDEPVLIDRDFSIIVKYTSVDKVDGWPIAVQDSSISGYENTALNKNQSFVSLTGTDWYDLSNDSTKFIPSIKAYTDNIDYDFTIDVDNLVKDNTKDKFTVPIDYNGIEDVDINNFEIKIFNSNNENVSDKFNVSNNLINDKNIIIERNDDNLDNGIYNVKITYGYITNECNINLIHQIKGMNINSLIIEPSPLISEIGGNIKVRLNLNNVELEEIFNSVSVKIYNSDNEEKYVVNNLEFNDKKYVDVEIPIDKNYESGEYKLVASVGIDSGLTGGTYSDEISFNIEPYIHVENISLNKQTIVLNKRESEYIVATVIPDNAMNKNINWSSSNTSVATVDNTGKVTGVGRGETIITVTSEDGNKTVSLNVLVQEPKVIIKSETISSDYNNILYEGYGGKIVYNIELQDISKDDLTIKYFKDDVDITNKINNVKFIENNGIYNLILNLDNQINRGNYKIQISNENIETIEKYFEVKEYIKVDSIDLGKNTIEIYQNESFDISSLISINPTNAINKNIKYQLSNSNIVLNGNIITGKVVGNCIIKIISVENESIYRELSVVVKEKYINFKNNINVLEENNVTYLRGLNINSNFNDLKSNISTNLDIKLYKKDEKTLVSNNDLVGTGMILKIGSDKFEMVIRGDINGDGKQTITDLSQLRQHLAEISGKIKTGAYLKAGDLNKDEKVSIIDLSKMRKELAG